LRSNPARSCRAALVIGESLTFVQDEHYAAAESMAQPDEQLIWFVRVIRGWKILFRPRRFSEFLEARIIPERIEHWIESQQRRSERGRGQCAIVRYRE
jgi:hypothetical protein